MFYVLDHGGSSHAWDVPLASTRDGRATPVTVHMLCVSTRKLQPKSKSGKTRQSTLDVESTDLLLASDSPKG